MSRSSDFKTNCIRLKRCDFSSCWREAYCRFAPPLAAPARLGLPRQMRRERIARPGPSGMICSDGTVLRLPLDRGGAGFRLPQRSGEAICRRDQGSGSSRNARGRRRRSAPTTRALDGCRLHRLPSFSLRGGGWSIPLGNPVVLAADRLAPRLGRAVWQAPRDVAPDRRCLGRDVRQWRGQRRLDAILDPGPAEDACRDPTLQLAPRLLRQADGPALIHPVRAKPPGDDGAIAPTARSPDQTGPGALTRNTVAFFPVGWGGVVMLIHTVLIIVSC